MSDRSNPFDPTNFDPFAMWREWFGRSEQQWSQGLSEMLKDERVAGSLGKEAQKAMLMQRMFAEVSERYLAYMNMPSRSDIEKLGERIGRLEDSIGSLQVEIAQLRGRAGSIADGGQAAPKRPARTRKPTAAG